VLESAEGINDQGDIVGWGIYQSAVTGFFLAHP